MEVKKLTKLTDEEVATLDPSTFAKIDTSTPEVEGQEPYIGIVECPWCGMRGRAILDTEYEKRFSCGNCNRPARI